jgi:hypothetical protein
MNHGIYTVSGTLSEDEKTLNHRVDQAVKQHTQNLKNTHRKPHTESHTPKATHPWKKIPATQGGYSHQV